MHIQYDIYVPLVGDMSLLVESNKSVVMRIVRLLRMGNFKNLN